MKKASRILLRILKISGITLGSVLILLFLAPYLFPDTVGRQIKQWTNQSIRGDLNFSSARLSFFTHFPSLTLTLNDVNLRGSAPYQQDTLLSAKKLGFGVNLQKLIFNHLVSVNKIYLNEAFIHVMVNEKGLANYDIYVPDTAAAKSNKSDSGASLHLEKVIIKDSRLDYHDLSVPMSIQAEHIYYEGTGDLSQSVFDLQSHIKTDSFNFSLDNHAYVRRKAFDAQLTTHVNTKTLALIFEHTQLRVNKLNMAFSGKLDFLKNGYGMDFSLSTQHADLYQLITIFPPEYLDWLRETAVKGSVDLTTGLRGKYIASTGEMPDYKLQLTVREGFISYKNAVLPVSQLNARLSLDLPSLNPEKMHLTIDSFTFRMSKDFFSGRWESTGFREPLIDGKVNAMMDLRNLNRAMGIHDFDMQGRLEMHASAKGRYSKKIIRTSLRFQDTVIASIPSFDMQCSFRNGLIKWAGVPQPVQNIFVIMHATCTDNDYRHALFRIDSLHAAALNNYIEGSATVLASADFPMDLFLRGKVNLADIRQVYPMDSLVLSGGLQFNINSTGKYAPEHHVFPKTSASFSLKDGFIQTKYYPHPIEKINVDALAHDESGDLNGLNVSIKPASLQFEGKPFYFSGLFKNFEDLNYHIAVDGELDLGRIYQVFARKDIGVTGLIKAHAAFAGKQSDALNQHYDLLQNSGTLEVRDIKVTADSFPKPFLISRGRFRFDEDKMWFETFQANYGKSDIQLDGFAENVINYLLSKNQMLKANFNLSSGRIDLNEFSVYAGTGTDPSQAATGVIIVPKTLDLTLRAEVGKINYNGMVLNKFQGGVNIKNGEIELTKTAFEMIGCHVVMNAKYSNQNTTRASFDYKLQATDFDVQRAYKEIKIFHDLASSAEHAAGTISLDYSLSGKLNEKMYPIYPSLKGAGVLSVKNVKFNGWKLFNTVSSQSGKTELKDPDLSKIDVKSSIKNNLITIEKTKFKTGGFRVRFEGQTSFDNKINFKMRIGLPPLGIIGIPLRITGNSDNPKIKMTKTDNDPLEEKEEE